MKLTQMEMKVETPAAGNVNKYSVTKIAPIRRVNFPRNAVEDNVQEMHHLNGRK